MDKSRRVLQRHVGVDVAELAIWSQEHLRWRKDWGNIPVGDNAGYWWTPEALQRYEAEQSQWLGDLWEASPDEVTWGVVTRSMPPNPRRIWIQVSGHEGRGEVSLPMKLAKRYRRAGKRIPVRHISGNIWQLAKVNWRDPS